MSDSGLGISLPESPSADIRPKTAPALCGRYTVLLPERKSGDAQPGDASSRLLVEQSRGSDAEAPYLQGLPEMSDFLAHLAAGRNVLPAEEVCIGRQVEKLCRLIREAREQWEAKQFDEIFSP